MRFIRVAVIICFVKFEICLFFEGQGLLLLWQKIWNMLFVTFHNSYLYIHMDRLTDILVPIFSVFYCICQNSLLSLQILPINLLIFIMFATFQFLPFIFLASRCVYFHDNSLLGHVYSYLSSFMLLPHFATFLKFLPRSLPVRTGMR